MILTWSAALLYSQGIKVENFYFAKGIAEKYYSG
jgi:hypothetical protein